MDSPPHTSLPAVLMHVLLKTPATHIHSLTWTIEALLYLHTKLQHIVCSHVAFVVAAHFYFLLFSLAGLSGKSSRTACSCLNPTSEQPETGDWHSDIRPYAGIV